MDSGLDCARADRKRRLRRAFRLLLGIAVALVAALMLIVLASAIVQLQLAAARWDAVDVGR